MHLWKRMTWINTYSALGFANISLIGVYGVCKGSNFVLGQSGSLFSSIILFVTGVTSPVGLLVAVTLDSLIY